LLCRSPGSSGNVSGQFSRSVSLSQGLLLSVVEMPAAGQRVSLCSLNDTALISCRASPLPPNLRGHHRMFSPTLYIRLEPLGIVQLCVQLEGFVLQPALALLSCPWGLAGRGEDSAEISWPSPTHALSGSRRGPGWDAGCAGPRGGRARGSSQALPSPSPKPGHIQKPQRRGQRTALPRSSRARHPPHPSLRAA